MEINRAQYTRPHDDITHLPAYHICSLVRPPTLGQINIPLLDASKPQLNVYLSLSLLPFAVSFARLSLMVLTFLPLCIFDVKRQYRKWTRRRGYVHLPSGCPSSPLSSTVPTSPCMPAPAPPHRRFPAHYSPFMAAVAFPPKLDYAHCQETRAFRSMGQSNSNYMVREQGGEKERQGKWMSGINSGGDRGGGRRRGFECARYVLERGDARDGVNVQVHPYASTQTPEGDRRHRSTSRPKSNTGTPMTTRSGSISIAPTSTRLGRRAAAGQGQRHAPPSLIGTTDAHEIVTEICGTPSKSWV